jgi:CDP-diacylglycerol--glycerol-3-phosphate 3-phosphatidyltransferase
VTANVDDNNGEAVGDAPSAATSTPGYGPSALATPANALTMLRLLAAPLLLLMVLDRATSWATWAAWTVLAGSDGIDGWLARRHGTTRSGAFLDPLADKFLVLGAMFALVADHRFWIVPVVIIAVREVAISMYRIVVGRHGVSVPARGLAKIKTLVQALAVGCVVWPVTGHHPILAVSLLWVAVGLTVVTGVQYFADARSGAHSRARPALEATSRARPALEATSRARPVLEATDRALEAAGPTDPAPGTAPA